MKNIFLVEPLDGIHAKYLIWTDSEGDVFCDHPVELIMGGSNNIPIGPQTFIYNLESSFVKKLTPNDDYQVFNESPDTIEIKWNSIGYTLRKGLSIVV